jgi:DNA-binding NarL/FixJ family response regulator
MWNVLIVEDDASMREFLGSSVAHSGDLVLAGSVGNVADARTWLAAAGRQVDVVLTDLGLPDGSGLEVIRLTGHLHPACDALVISVFGDDENVLASIEAGAVGYIHKDAAPDDIAQTVREMKAGASPISPMIARRVLAKYVALRAELEPTPRPRTLGDAVSLSPREQEVLELIARGFSYAEIARVKEVSVHTVQTHIKNLYRKLAVRSKNEAVFEATQLGLLDGQRQRTPRD